MPGGFGQRGTEGMIVAVKWAREHKIPFLGICLGLQVAVIEWARHVCGLTGANSTELEAETAHPAVIFMPEISRTHLGGTMRLGLRPTIFEQGSEQSQIRQLYGNKEAVWERHRHRYEVNPKLVPTFEAGTDKNGEKLRFIGKDERGERMQIIEMEGASRIRAWPLPPPFYDLLTCYLLLRPSQATPTLSPSRRTRSSARGRSTRRRRSSASSPPPPARLAWRSSSLATRPSLCRPTPSRAWSSSRPTRSATPPSKRRRPRRSRRPMRTRPSAREKEAGTGFLTPCISLPPPHPVHSSPLARAQAPRPPLPPPPTHHHPLSSRFDSSWAPGGVARPGQRPKGTLFVSRPVAHPIEMNRFATYP